MTKLIVCSLAGLLAGCFLPVGTGAPLPATTVGHGHVGVALTGEAPTVDLIAKDDNSTNQTYTDTYGASPAAAMSFTLEYGLTDDTDIEVAAEGELWLFFLPLPTGGSIGVRHHMWLGDDLDFALAGRIGGVAAGASVTDSSGDASSDSASAVYGAAQGVVQLRRGFVRPLAALSLMPFRIKRDISGDPQQRFAGLASSLTFGVAFGRAVQLEPYLTVTDFASTQYAGGVLVSGGLMLAIRPQRNDRSAPPPPPPPAYGPPPGATAPTPAPAVAPAPAP